MSGSGQAQTLLTQAMPPFNHVTEENFVKMRKLVGLFEE
jgi:hypothetical protein